MTFTPLLRVNELARFVRWHQTREGDWYPEVLKGRFQHGPSEGWTVTVKDVTRFLPCTAWLPYDLDGRSTGASRAASAYT